MWHKEALNCPLYLQLHRDRIPMKTDLSSIVMSMMSCIFRPWKTYVRHRSYLHFPLLQSSFSAIHLEKNLEMTRSVARSLFHGYIWVTCHVAYVLSAVDIWSCHDLEVGYTWRDWRVYALTTRWMVQTTFTRQWHRMTGAELSICIDAAV